MSRMKYLPLLALFLCLLLPLLVLAQKPAGGELPGGFPPQDVVHIPAAA